MSYIVESDDDVPNIKTAIIHFKKVFKSVFSVLMLHLFASFMFMDFMVFLG